MSGNTSVSALPAMMIGMMLWGLTITPSAAQYEPLITEQVDDFTGLSTLWVKPRDSGKGPEFTWIAKGGRCRLEMRWRQSGLVPGVVLVGDTLMLKLENDQVLVLVSAMVAIGEHTRDPKGDASTVTTCTYAVTADQLQELAQNWTQKMRVRFYDGWQSVSCVGDLTWQYAFSNAASALIKQGGLEPPPVEKQAPPADPKVVFTTRARR